MVSENIIKIILKMEDQASQVAQKADQMINKLGNSAQQSNNKTALSVDKVNQKYTSTTNSINRVAQAATRVGENGAKSFNNMGESTQRAVVNFNRLDESSQILLKNWSQLSNQSKVAFAGLDGDVQLAISKFDALQNETRNWSNTLDYTKTKLSLMGTDVDSLRGKIQVVGSTIQEYVGTKWDLVKNKVTVFGDYIKTHLSSALQTVRSHIDNLSNAFSGLGGFIASAIGGLGMASITDMTIGLAMGRERMTALMQATTGSKEATNDLIKGYENLNYTFKNVDGTTTHMFEGLDEMTNKSLVSLDDLGQAMSNFKMATGATNDQLAYVAPLLNDIGQRAILMGKSGDEALTLMQAAATGLNGNFMTLKYNFGVTKEKLEDLGWSGATDDIEGYTDALMKYLNQSGNMNDMMNTTVGHIERVKKDFRVAGRTVGEMFTPYIDQAALALHGLYEKCPQLYQGLIMVAGGVSGFVSIAPMLAPMLMAFDSLLGKGRVLLTFFGLLEAEEGALTASTLANTIAIKANEIAQAARGVVTSGLVTENAALNASMAGLTAEEIGAAAAHAVNSGALGAESVAAATAAGANITLADSLWAVATALLANPITWIVIAVIALAVAVYEVGKAFGWWKDIPTLFAAVWSGIQRLWDAFINHPDVQAVIGALVVVWDALVSAIGWVISQVENFFGIHINGEFDIVRALIESIGIAWQVITTPIRVAITLIQMAIGVITSIGDALGITQQDFMNFLGFLAGAIVAPVQFVVSVLRTIICILLGCSPGIVPALQKVWEVFQEVFNAIAGFIGGIISPIVEAIQPLIDIFVGIVTYLVEMFMPVWNLLSGILTIVWNNVSLLIGIFQLFLSGQITLPQMLGMIWGIIQQTFVTILTLIINFVGNWAGALVAKAINAGSGFVNGIISFVSGLPGRVWSFLVQTSQRIISAGAQWVSNARGKASEMNNAVISFVSQLPGKVYTEFMNIGNRMLQAGSQLVEKAKKIGGDIVNGLLNAMGIHSPGIIQESVVAEFWDTVEQIKDVKGKAGEYARQVGEEIVDKFGEPKLSLNTDDLMPYYDLDANPLENVDMANIDLSSISGGLDDTTGMTEETNTMIGESYNALAMMMQNTLNNMVLADQLAYSTMQSNDLTTLQNIQLGLNTSLMTMSNNLRMQLNQMLNTHRTAMTQATNVTRTQLNQMLMQTTKVTAEMRSAWGVMADSIIGAAARIQSEATAYFDKLSSTIGTFYRKLQNPSQWAGGGTGSASTTRSVGRDPAVMSRLTRGVANSLRRDNQLPYTITAVKAKQSNLVDPVTLEYMNKTSSSRLNVLDLLQSGICPNCVAGGWDDVVPPNVAYIKSTAREWQMKGPAIHTGVGDVDTGLAFKVSDFETGTPKISWGSFVKIATALASAIPYDYYYDSSKYGSWQNALAHGAWNCYDGASAMVALANACGYSGYVNCGLNWGSDGHCCAIINGYTFDTTALRQRGGWTAGPCSYSAPAPSAGGINLKLPNRSSPPKSVNPLDGLFDLEGIFDGNDGDVEVVNETTTEEIQLKIEHDVNVVVEGKTEDIDTDALISQVQESITDKSIINKIADALIKRDRKIARMRGA